MYKKILLYYIFLLIFLIKICVGILEDISGESFEYIKYPSYSSEKQCIFSFILLSDATDTPFIYDDISYNVQQLHSNSTILYTEILVTVDYGSYASIVGNTLKNITLNYQCLKIDLPSLEFKVVPNYHINRNLPTSPLATIYISGLRYPLKRISVIGSETGLTQVSFGVYELEENETYENDKNITLLFDQVNYILLIPSKFTKRTDYESAVLKFPSTEVFNALGSYQFPLYKISTKTNVIDPVYYPGYPYDVITALPKPIYSKGGNITYIGQILSNPPSGKIYTATSLFSKNDLQVNEFDTFNITINEFSFAPLPSTQASLLDNFDRFTLGIDVGYYKFNKFEYRFGLAENIFEWPFGFVHGSNLLNYQYKVSLVKKINYIGVNIQFYILTIGKSGGQLYTNIPVTTNTGEEVPPVNIPGIVSLEMVHLYDFKILIKMILNDGVKVGIIKIEGVDNILYNGRCESYDQYSESNSFEIVIDYRQRINKIIVSDIFGQYSEWYINSYYSPSILPIRKVELPSIFNDDFLGTIHEDKNNIHSITNITWFYNNVEIKDKSVSNIMYFNFSQSFDQDKPIALMLLDPVSFKKDIYDRKLYFAKWNSTILKYQIEFKIPANTQDGILPWSLMFSPTSFYYNSIVPSSNQLYVVSPTFDAYGPIISEIGRFSIYADRLIYWTISIVDEINGFDYGDITVRGESDNSLYKFHLTPANRTSGDIYRGYYTISIPMVDWQYCVNQKYIITDIKLFDRQGNDAWFSVGEEIDNLKNPLISFLGVPDPTSASSNFCNDLFDTTGPELLLPSVALTFFPDKINFKFTAQDLESGIKPDQYPIVYVTTAELHTIQCVSNIVTYTHTEAIYNCTIDLPHAFAHDSHYIYSIYGFINNGGYYSGFESSAVDPSNTVYSPDGLSTKYKITSTSSITSNGGKLWIYGNNFRNVVKVEVGFSDGTKIQLSKVDSYTNLASIIINKQLTDPITVEMVGDTGIRSNVWTVYPEIFIYDYVPSVTTTPIVTNAPKTCLGEPVCGGANQGYCSPSSGCVCYPPFIGIDCSSKVIIVPKPTANSTDPSTEIIIPEDGSQVGSGENIVDNVLFKSLISLVSVRELDMNSVKVNEYQFDKWVYNEIDSNTNEYHTNITVTSGGTTSLTSIKVTLQWFKDSANITFANEKLLMSPSSIKYTIELSNYKFQSNLNSLQLIMSASFSASKSNDICSLKEFGETTSGDNSNYIKVQVGDHSLYGRFIKRAIVDKVTIINIDNVLLDSSLNSISSASSVQSFIGINIPHYKSSIIIDPDFSVLLDNNDASNNDNSICTSSKSKLSTAQLAGIIVGAVVFAVAITTAVVYHIVKKKNAIKLIKTMQVKLQDRN